MKTVPAGIAGDSQASAEKKQHSSHNGLSFMSDYEMANFRPPAPLLLWRGNPSTLAPDSSSTPCPERQSLQSLVTGVELEQGDALHTSTASGGRYEAGHHNGDHSVYDDFLSSSVAPLQPLIASSKTLLKLFDDELGCSMFKNVVSTIDKKCHQPTATAHRLPHSVTPLFLLLSPFPSFSNVPTPPPFEVLAF